MEPSSPHRGVLAAAIRQPKSPLLTTFERLYSPQDKLVSQACHHLVHLQLELFLPFFIQAVLNDLFTISDLVFSSILFFIEVLSQM